MIFRLECEIRDLQEEKKVLERKGHGRLKVKKSIYVILSMKYIFISRQLPGSPCWEHWAVYFNGSQSFIITFSCLLV